MMMVRHLSANVAPAFVFHLTQVVFIVAVVHNHFFLFFCDSFVMFQMWKIVNPNVLTHIISGDMTTSKDQERSFEALMQLVNHI